MLGGGRLLGAALALVHLRVLALQQPLPQAVRCRSFRLGGGGHGVAPQNWIDAGRQPTDQDRLTHFVKYFTVSVK
ncbi:hypothetical protein GCM10010174_75500 [Kutzneria viridogrisea]